MLIDMRTAHATGQSGAVRWLSTSSRPSVTSVASSVRSTWVAA
jgi:hypothetical protein